MSDSWERSRVGVNEGRVRNKHPDDWLVAPSRRKGKREYDEWGNLVSGKPQYYDMANLNSYVTQSLNRDRGYEIFPSAPGGVINFYGEPGFIKSEFIQNWGNRKMEYRWDRPGQDIEAQMQYAADLMRKEMIDVIGRGWAPNKKDANIFDRLQAAIKMAPYMATQFEERMQRFAPKQNEFFERFKRRAHSGISERYLEQRSIMTQSFDLEPLYDVKTSMPIEDFGKHNYDMARGRHVKGDPRASYIDMDTGKVLGAGGYVLPQDISLDMSGMRGTKTLEEFKQWYYGVGETYGWDVIRSSYLYNFDYDFDAVVRKHYNKLVSREM